MPLVNPLPKISSLAPGGTSLGETISVALEGVVTENEEMCVIFDLQVNRPYFYQKWMRSQAIKELELLLRPYPEGDPWRSRLVIREFANSLLGPSKKIGRHSIGFPTLESQPDVHPLNEEYKKKRRPKSPLFRPLWSQSTLGEE